MKRLSFIALLLATLWLRLSAQEAQPKAYLVDEFENIFCSDPFRTKIDNFFAEISRTNSTGYVVASFDSSIPGRSEDYLNSIQKHVEFRKFDPSRINFIRTADGNSTRFYFWLVPEGAEPLRIDSYQNVALQKTTLFDSSRIQKVKHGEVEFGEDGIEPCDSGLDLRLFADALKTDENATAYLLAASANARSHTKAKAALRLTAATLTKTHNVPSERIKAIYAGIRKESEMQLWLVPRGGQIPKFRSGTLR